MVASGRVYSEQRRTSPECRSRERGRRLRWRFLVARRGPAREALRRRPRSRAAGYARGVPAADRWAIPRRLAGGSILERRHNGERGAGHPRAPPVKSHATLELARAGKRDRTEGERGCPAPRPRPRTPFLVAAQARRHVG